MGWTSFHMKQPIKNWFKDQWDYPDSHYEVIDSVLVSFTRLYGAVKDKRDGSVFCAVFLISWSPKDYYNFSYKDMSEFAGPVVIDCPEKIFKLLTPLNDEDDPNGWARNWRKKVENYHVKRKLLKKKDVIIKTKEPIEFVDGEKYQYFKKEGKRMLGGNLIDGKFKNDGFVHIRNFASRFDFELI